MIKQGSLIKYLIVTSATGKDKTINMKTVNIIKESARFQNSSQES